MSDFQELAAEVMRATRLNTDYFAQDITYRTAQGDEIECPVHVRHSVRIDRNKDTNSEEIVEQIHVELDREDVPYAPEYGCRILLANETEAYLYAYRGTDRFTSWKATFERRRMAAQGV